MKLNKGLFLKETNKCDYYKVSDIVICEAGLDGEDR